MVLFPAKLILVFGTLNRVRSKTQLRNGRLNFHATCLIIEGRLPPVKDAFTYPGSLVAGFLLNGMAHYPQSSVAR